MHFNLLYEHYIGPDGSVGIAKRDGLVSSGIETLCGRDCPLPSSATLGPIQPTAQWVPSLSWG